jgi:hypothetical protein
MALLIKRIPLYATMVNGHPNWVRIWSYKNFIVTTIMLMFKALASTNLMA